MFRRFLRHKVIRDKGLLLIFPKPPLFTRLLPGTFVGNVKPGLSTPHSKKRGPEFPARPSRNRMTARVNDERRNFGASHNFRVHQALGNLRTPRRFRTLVERKHWPTLDRPCRSAQPHVQQSIELQSLITLERNFAAISRRQVKLADQLAQSLSTRVEEFLGNTFSLAALQCSH